MDTGRLWPLATLLLVTLLAGCSRSDIYEYFIDRERRLAGLSEQQIDVGELRISYLTNDRLEGRDSLLLIHGFGGSKDNWVRMAAHLSDDYNLLIPDLAGHGDSSTGTESDYPVEAQAATLTRFLDELDTASVHMAGNSMGGGITLYFASRYPERVRSISLYDPAGSDRYPAELDEQLEQGNNPLVVRESGDFRRLMDFVLEQKPFIPWPLGDVMEREAIARQDINDRIFAAIQASAEDYHPEQIMATVSVPALIVWGEQDRVLHPDNARVFEQHLPDARLVMLENVGHVPMLEVPERSAQLMREFIAGISSDPEPASPAQR